MLRLLACLGLALFAPLVAAQERATVNGYVRDAASGETLLLANVVVAGTTTGATTNNSGYYTLGLDVPAGGTVRLIASYVGFRSQAQDVTLAPGQALRLDFDLQNEATVGEEVVVEAEAPIEDAAAVGVLAVPMDLIESLPSAFEADLFRSLQLLPGVKSANDFSSKLYIRGGSPDQTLIQLDGTTVYNPTHFFGFFSTFNTAAIKDARIYKGAYPAEYGGRLGSVIDVYNRDGNRNELAGSATLGLLASRALVEGPVTLGNTKGSFLFAARRSTLEPLLAALQDQIDDIPESFYFFDLNGKLTLDLTPKDKVQFGFYAGRDKVRFPFAEDAEFRLDYGNATGSLAYTRILTETLFVTTRAAGSYYFNFPDAELSGTEIERDNELTDFSLKTDLEWLPSSSFRVKGGAGGGLFGLTLRDRFSGTVTLEQITRLPYGSGYAEAEYRFGDGYIATGGLRADYFGGGNYVRFGPRLKFEKKFGEGLIAQAAYGRYYQFLTLISSEAFSGFDVWTTTADGVRPSYGDQLALGLKVRLADGTRIETEIYGRTMEDLFDINPTIQDLADREYDEIFRFGSGYAYGWEMLVQRDFGRVTGLFGYTLSTTRRKFEPGPLYPGSEIDLDTGALRAFAPKYDRLHDVNAVLTYDLGRAWSATVSGLFQTGQAYTNPQQYYEVEGTADIGLDFDTPILVTEQLNAARLPNYHRMDIGFAKEGRFFSFGDYELQLQAINIYNRRNVWFYQIDTDENPVGFDPVRQLPFLPNVSLTVDF